MNLPSERNTAPNPPCTVLMLLTNSYDPDPRVRQEALALLRMGCRVKLLAWDRDMKSPALECMEGVEVERVFLPSKHGRGTTQIFFYAWLYMKMFWKAWRTSFDAVHCHDLDTLPPVTPVKMFNGDYVQSVASSSNAILAVVRDAGGASPNQFRSSRRRLSEFAGRIRRSCGLRAGKKNPRF